MGRIFIDKFNWIRNVWYYYNRNRNMYFHTYYVITQCNRIFWLERWMPLLMYVSKLKILKDGIYFTLLKDCVFFCVKNVMSLIVSLFSWNAVIYLVQRKPQQICTKFLLGYYKTLDFCIGVLGTLVSSYHAFRTGALNSFILQAWDKYFYELPSCHLNKFKGPLMNAIFKIY